MWTSTLDLDPKRVIITQLLRPIWPGISFSSFAPLQVQNLPRQPLPEKTWVRVRNRLAGICGSDLHMVQGDGDFRIAPAALPLHRRSYPGHEVVGEVLEVGEDVQRIHVGDRVVLQYGPNCLSTGVQAPCRSCASGYYNLCEHGKLPDPHPIGGGWSEEMLLSEQQLFRLPADMSDEQAVLLEPTAVAIHAVLRRLPQQNERILIIGAGAIGLLTLQIIRALAPRAEVSVMARHSFQIEQATRLGAAHIIYPQNSYTDIQRATDAQIYKGAFGNQMLLGGYDVIFDTVGSQKTLHHALRWAQAQATVILVGINLHQMQIDLTPVWYQEVNLIGSMGSGIETWPPATNERRSTFEVAAELIQHEQIHPEHLITHRFPLNNYQTALLTAAGKAQSHAIKVVFDYSLLPPSVVPNVRASAVRKPHAPSSNENTSMPEMQDSQEGVPSPAQPTEPALPAASLSPLFSSSRTVAPPQYEDDEFDEMEDTISAPAIAKFDRHTPAPQRQKVQHAWLEEDVTTLPTIPVIPIPPAVPAMSSTTDEETPSAFSEQDIPGEDDMRPEVATEADAIEPMKQPEDRVETDDEPPAILPEKSVSQEDETRTEPETEVHLAAAAETAQDSEEAFDFPLLPVQEKTEHSEIPLDDVAQAAIEPVEQSADTEQYNSAQSEQNIAEVPSDPSEMSEELAAQPDTFEHPEPSTPVAQDRPPHTDSIEEEKIGTGSATRDTENALLHTEGQLIAKAQNRPRPRTRKKNNRASVEKR